MLGFLIVGAFFALLTLVQTWPTYEYVQASFGRSGGADLDFRSDIYSLGSMLYHLVTGHLMFEGYPDDEILEMQLTDRVQDAMDINPDVSEAVCWLMKRRLSTELLAFRQLISRLE